MTKRSPLRGEVWWIDWSPGRGSEQTGVRPGLIVQRDAANRNPSYPNTMVVAISTKGRDLPFHIRLKPSPQNGLYETSFAKCEQTQTIGKERLVERIGRISNADLTRVSEGLRLVLDL